MCIKLKHIPTKLQTSRQYYYSCLLYTSGSGFVDAFFILLFRYGICHDPGSASNKNLPVFLVGDTNRNTGVHISCEVDVSNGAAIDSPLVVFKFSDKLTSPDLRCTGKCSGRQYLSLIHI